ncbi:hypothetical protein VSS37_08120 [Candidatus Thiothrix sp. Deng01]|uniref:Uncharacterized protein n=1 Tax=Candidatus Thiothrix phosphatis TaxID=3112415 RepID=A0ABU6CVU8_9GAMM|nr:hypothetical protein [Candidatus Thiothrix sp. Deng01]MEB4590938.1 hypothetical protein [Candidatus Thiothrix sp. Deng01]
MHLDLDHAVAGTGFAAPALDVEGETGGARQGYRVRLIRVDLPEPVCLALSQVRQIEICIIRKHWRQPTSYIVELAPVISKLSAILRTILVNNLTGFQQVGFFHFSDHKYAIRGHIALLGQQHVKPKNKSNILSLPFPSKAWKHYSSLGKAAIIDSLTHAS